jgi:4-hydroxy-tetrahydrodipicolinate synthase
MFQGSIPALITPFINGKVDTDAFKKLVEWQITEGSDGLVPCGTTGESPTLSHNEHMHVTEVCIDAAAGRVPVIAGAGSNSTDEAVMLASHAKKAGAQAALVVMPYYNKPTPEGQYRHFKEVHDAANLPIIIYNIPGRSVVDMTLETMARLAKLPNVVGVKDATSDLVRPIQTHNLLGDNFCQLSGEDATALAHLVGGGKGCISVSANVAPRLVSNMQRAWREGRHQDAIDIQFRLMPLHDALFCESSPGPVKYLAELLGICSSESRLPICEISDESKQKVKAAAVSVGLLN